MRDSSVKSLALFLGVFYGFLYARLLRLECELGQVLEIGSSSSSDDAHSTTASKSCWVVGLHHDPEPHSELSVETLAVFVRTGNKFGCEVFILTTIAAPDVSRKGDDRPTSPVLSPSATSTACAHFFLSHPTLQQAGRFECEDRVNLGREQSAYAHFVAHNYERIERAGDLRLFFVPLPLWKYERGNFLQCALDEVMTTATSSPATAGGEAAAAPPPQFGCFSGGEGPLRYKGNFSNHFYKGQLLTPTDAKNMEDWYSTVLRRKFGPHLPSWKKLVDMDERTCLTGVFFTQGELLRRKPREFYETLEELMSVDHMGGEASHFSERLVSVFFGGGPCHRRSFKCDPKGLAQFADGVAVRERPDGCPVDELVGPASGSSDWLSSLGRTWWDPGGRLG